MAKSTASGGAPTNYDLRTQAGAHAAMQALSTHLLAVGLTSNTFTGRYDVAGSSSQMPTVLGNASPWMAFDFSDAAQATYPITVAFRFLYQSSFSSAAATAAYRPQFRVSEGVASGTGDPLGRYVLYDSNAVGGSPSASGDSFKFYVQTSKGDFVRYSGDALTLIVAANGASNPSNGGGPCSLFDLHIERMRDATTGAVQAGFAGLTQPPRLGNSGGHYPVMTADAGQSAERLPLCFVNLSTPLTPIIYNSHLRAGGANCLLDGTTAVVAPIYYRDANGHFSALKKLFTVPTASIPDTLATYTLDFSGGETLYLAHRPGGSNGLDAVASYSGETTLLYEWE